MRFLCDSCSRWSLESAESVTRAVGEELQQSVARLDVGFWTPVRIKLYCEAQARVRQGSARDGSQGERPQSLNPCLELTLKLVAPPSFLPTTTGSLIFLMFMAGMVQERLVGTMEGILEQSGLCYYAGMAIIEDGVWLGQYIMPYMAT